jgi:hypothetical protein
MLSKSNLRSPRWFRYGSSALLSLMLCATPATVFAHVGHDSEFQGGDASQIMQPVEVNTNTAEAMGIKSEPLAPSTSGSGALSIPSSSIVDANGQKLVYVQKGATYQPVAIVTGATDGDMVEVTEGNLSSGDAIVTQGATLLYSQALRGNSQKEAAPTGETGISPLLWIGIIAGLGVFGTIAFVGAMGLQGQKKQKPSRASQRERETL